MLSIIEHKPQSGTDSLTLLVCLDADGKASGQLYEDDGDGFAYRRGNYLLSRFEATLLKRQLTVTMTAAEGKRQDKARTLRIGCVKGGRVQYSPWQQGSTATMKVK